jgi:hypothetical protein
MTVAQGQTIRQLQAVDDGAGLLVLLRLNHASWAAPICIVNDTRDLEHGGETYTALPFAVTLPNDKAKEAPRVKLQMDNVGRDIGALFEALPPAAFLMATLSLVSRATPEVKDWSFTAPVLRPQISGVSATAEMGWDAVMRRAVVRRRFDSRNTPGLFSEV